MELKLIVTIVKRGKGHEVTHINKRSGASFSTIMLSRGSSLKDKNKHLNIYDHESEIVLSIIRKSFVKTALDNLIQELELDKPGRGMAFTIPINGFACEKSLIKLVSSETTETINKLDH